MNAEEIRTNILDPKKLRLPAKPKVIDLKVSPYTDHHGWDSLWIYVILDDSTTRADRTARNLDAIDLAIHDALLAAGIDLFPYTMMVTPSDVKEAGIKLSWSPLSPVCSANPPAGASGVSASSAGASLMKVEEIRAKILDPKKLRLPAKPKVTDLNVSPYTDHHGWDSLWIYVILDDSTTPADRTARNLDAIDLAISDALLAAGIDLFPYTVTVTPSDIKEAGIKLR